MKKFFIIFSGAYVALAGAILTTVFIAGYFYTPQDAGAPNKAAPFFLVLPLLFSLWVLSSGIGVICKKEWARISLFIVCFFTLLVGIVYLLSLVFVPWENSPGLDASLAKLSTAVFSLLFFVAVPVAFMVFFSREPVKKVFLEGLPADKISPRPFGVTLLAVFTFLGAISSLIYAFTPGYQKLPFIGSIFVSGMALKVAFFIVSFINLYIASGLLGLKKNAFRAGLAYWGIIIAVGVINIFAVSQATLNEMIVPMAQQQGPGAVSIVNYRASQGIGLLVSLAIVAYLVSKKSLFFNINNSPNTQ